MSWHDAASADDLLPSGKLCVDLEGQRVLLVADSGRVHALAPLCTHAGAPLEKGRVRGGKMVCPRHGMRFDLADGSPHGPLTNEPLATWRCRVEDGRVQVDLRTKPGTD